MSCRGISDHLPCCCSKNDCTPANTKWYAVALLVISVVILGGTFASIVYLITSGTTILNQIGLGWSIALPCVGLVVGIIGVVGAVNWLCAAKESMEKSNRSHSLLHRLARSGNASEIESLKQREDIDINEKVNGFTPLHEAVDFNRLKTTQTLLILDADVNRPDSNGNMPLHLAAYRGNVDIIKALLEKKADVNKQNNGGNTPLHLAIQEGNDRAVAELVKAPGLNINQFNHEGLAPVHLAATRGNLRLLLTSDLSLNLPDGKKGRTPLHFAVMAGNSGLVELLLLNDVEQIRDNDGKTPLDLAIENTRTDILGVFLQVRNSLTVGGRTIEPVCSDEHNDAWAAYKQGLAGQGITITIRNFLVR